MQINRIYLKNFKSYSGESSFIFDRLTIVKGENGKGKSTLVVDSLLFALFGYSSQPLASLPSRKISTSCLVRIELTYLSSLYIIEREYPSKLRIYKNGIELKFNNISEAQEYLNTIFINVDYIRKFRTIDNSKGINILEEGKTSFKKTLFSLHEDTLYKVRNSLMLKKNERETFNKDKVVWKHFPSQKRLDILNKEIANIYTETKNIQFQLNKKYEEKNILSSKKAICLTEIKHENILLDLLVNYNQCPSCKQEINENYKNNNVNNIQETINNYKEDIILIEKDIIAKQKEINDIQRKLSILEEKKSRLNTLSVKLEGRIKQKEYKWSTRDVLIIKKSIEELDKFYNLYLSNWIKVIEPILNNVISKIGFTLTFTRDFDIKLTKDDKIFTYKELSEGQKLIVSIAFKIALLLERGEEGFIIADEGFSSLDAENLNYILKLFKDLPFQLLAVIHRFEPTDEAVKVINI